MTNSFLFAANAVLSLGSLVHVTLLWVSLDPSLIGQVQKAAVRQYTKLQYTNYRLTDAELNAQASDPEETRERHEAC